MAPTCSMHLILLCLKILNQHNDESKYSDNDSEFDAFTEELDNNLYDLIAYGFFLIMQTSPGAQSSPLV